MSKNRELFLKQHWVKYPETPRGALRFGRVHQMRVGNYNLSDWGVPEGLDYKGSEILVDGDIVAIMQPGMFTLMAPNLTSDSQFYSLENDPWTNKRNWFEYQQHIRDFFREKRFLEVKTPTLEIGRAHG